MMDNGRFDPALCPLLQNLSPAEIAERLKEPQFQACIARIEGGETAGATAKPRGVAAARPPCMEAA